MDELLTQKEMAERLKVSYATLDRWIKRGGIPVIWFGKQKRFMPKEVIRFFRQQSAEKIAKQAS